MTQRSGRPPFLTNDDFANQNLECKLYDNHHAVYALTINVPHIIYERMTNDAKIGQLKILKSAHFDGDSVHIMGKIGETTNFQKRIYQYNRVSSSGNSMY